MNNRWSTKFYQNKHLFVLFWNMTFWIKLYEQQIKRKVQCSLLLITQMEEKKNTILLITFVTLFVNACRVHMDPTGTFRAFKKLLTDLQTYYAICFPTTLTTPKRRKSTHQENLCFAANFILPKPLQFHLVLLNHLIR